MQPPKYNTQNTTPNTQDIEKQEQIKREMAQVAWEENMYQYQEMLEENLDNEYHDVDFDSLEEEYKDRKEEELSLDKELEKLKEVTEKLEECNNLDKEFTESLELTEEKKITR